MGLCSHAEKIAHRERKKVMLALPPKADIGDGPGCPLRVLSCNITSTLGSSSADRLIGQLRHACAPNAAAQPSMRWIGIQPRVPKQ